MSVYVNSAPKLRAQRFNLAFVSAAALLVVTLLGTFLFANRPTGDDDVNAILPAAQSTETPTAAPTIVPTATPLPATVLPPTPTLMDYVPQVRPNDVYPAIGGAAMPVMCTGETSSMSGMELRSLPTLQQGLVVGYMPFNTAFQVVDMYQAETEGWYYVVGEVGVGLWRVQGWLQANALITDGECIYNYSEDAGVAQVTYIIQPGDTLLSIAVQFDLDVEDLPHLIELNNLGDGSTLPAPGETLIIEVPSNRPPQMRAEAVTSTPLPTVPPPDPMAATATQIIIDATRTAEGALSVTATATPIGQ